MRTCWKCGKALADEVERCPACGNVSALEKAAKDGGPAAPKAQAKSGRAELNPLEVAEKVRAGLQQHWEERVMPVINHPVVVSVDAWLFKNWKWFAIGAAALVGLAAGVWAINQAVRGAAQAKVEAEQQVADDTAKQLGVLIQEELPEKLEWGRDVMKRRVPGRFPEELSMEVDKAKGELRFMNRQKTKALYRLLICYHYRNAHQKSYVWEPVTFYFEKTGQHWSLTGDKWLSEWEITFE